MKQLHIEGMGVLGCMTAWQLYRRGIGFTWSDIESPVNAWRASTGGIFPTGDKFDMDNYAAWEGWYDDPPWADVGVSLVEKADFWFLSKNPPHGGRYAIKERILGLSRGELASYHVNVQQLVLLTRKFFESLRENPDGRELTLVAHGFNERLGRYLWGWSAKVRLGLAGALANRDYRPCLYLRQGKFICFYAYPVPEESTWYIGSSRVSQKLPNELLISAKYLVAEAFVSDKTDGMAWVDSVESISQGWRPVGSGGESPQRMGNRIVYPPMSGNGLRHAPDLMRAVLDCVL